jgi:ABC-type polysaccharide/polyol phosphate export permease
MTAGLRYLAADVREMVAEQLQYRELLIRMTERDLRVRYKQSVMGVGWALGVPLVNTLLFSVIFTRVAPIATDVPYPLFAVVGLVAWNMFAGSLRSAVVSLTSNATLVSKVYFPRELFPISGVIVACVDGAIAATLVLALMAWYGVGLTPAILFLPVVVLVQIVFTIAVSLLLAMGNLFFRDVKYLIEVVLTVWMFATAVVFPIAPIGGRLGVILRLNPMTSIIEAYRTLLFRGELPELAHFAGTAGVAIAAMACAWIVFHRAEFRFAERV